MTCQDDWILGVSKYEWTLEVGIYESFQGLVTSVQLPFDDKSRRGGAEGEEHCKQELKTRRKVRRRLATWEWSELADGGEVR